MRELVAIRDLKVHFSTRSGMFRSGLARAVDGVSLSIGEAETLALVGESGCGKTTLGRAMLRLIEPTAGDVVFDGESILTFDRRRLREYRKQAQAIFQDPYSSMSPYMTIAEIVSEPLKIHGIDADVSNAIAQVKLHPVEEILSKYPHSLSGGQRQRVSVARALTLRPRFIVADEPVSMVDASNRVEILSLLRSLQEDNRITFLYITHDLASARHFSDRIAVMYLGTVVETGPTKLIVDAALHPYTRGLLAAVPDASAENRTKLRETMPGELPNAMAVPTGCPFHSRCRECIPGTCDVVRPDTQSLADGRTIACHLYSKGTSYDS